MAVNVLILKLQGRGHKLLYIPHTSLYPGTDSPHFYLLSLYWCIHLIISALSEEHLLCSL